MKKIKSLGCKAGLTLNPATPASTLAPALPLADLVLVMTVHPGYSGQSFMPEMVAKIAEVRQMLDELGSPAWLEVDGGISAADHLPGPGSRRGCLRGSQCHLQASRRDCGRDRSLAESASRSVTAQD